MSYRGRLIWPIYADIASLDTSATSSAPGAGVVTSGYDPDFREPVIYDQGASLPDVSSRREILTTNVPCQVHSERGDYDNLVMMTSGGVQSYALRLVFHYADLETLGFVDSNGESRFRINDRLVALFRQGRELDRRYTTPELFVTQVHDRSFGLSGRRRNLLMLTFENRQTSLPNA